VLSTVHTNDAAGAISRLRDYDLPSFVINSALLGVVGQRLVRRICQHCVVPDEPDEFMRRRFRLGDEVDGFVRGKGCGRCSQSGYRGRLGIYELFTLTSAIKRLIEDEASIDRIRATAMAEGMRLMWQDGLDKARLGQTTLTEVLKVASVLSLGEVVEEKRVAA
jgi:type II secretory ATPase GspE/PulE/Tfp pilus assembly ATPase PilB-like protein